MEQNRLFNVASILSREADTYELEYQRFKAQLEAIGCAVEGNRAFMQWLIDGELAEMGFEFCLFDGDPKMRSAGMKDLKVEPTLEKKVGNRWIPQTVPNHIKTWTQKMWKDLHK